MKINFKKQIDYWLKAAESDIETARSILKTRKNLHYCLFFCHLTIEKHIKALIVRNTQQMPPRSHDLEFLAEKAGIKLELNDLDFLTEMNGFNLETRYPDEQFEIYKKATVTRTKKYFKRTEEFTIWLQQEITQ